MSTGTLPAPNRRTRKRPFGVTVIALMQGLASSTTGFSWVLLESPLGILRDHEEVSRAAVFGFVMLGIVIAAGLWRLKRWAWVATMLWFGFTMAGALITWWQSNERAYPLMVLSIVAVFYLNQRDVQQAFGMDMAGTPATGPTPETAPVRKGIS